MRILEINTWPWLAELAELGAAPVTLATVRPHEWDALAAYGFDAIWLMGVWRRSAAGREAAKAEPRVTAACGAAYPGFEPSRDLVGSPYCVAGYVVDRALGGPEALAHARAELRRRGLKLLLDFVPNHTAPDHPWIVEHPEYYVRGAPALLQQAPGRFFRTPRGDVVAHGAPSPDPADVWTDTAQLNALHPGARAALARAVEEIGDQCDGVRCDMAMLARSDAFAATWGDLAGPRPDVEFWVELIERVRRRHPALLWIAESYSGSEWSLQRDGFDLCYDKDLLYERLARGTARALREHLQGASLEFQHRLLHFIEAHDEPPAEQVFQPPARLWMASVAVATLPGSSLWYANQLEGRWGRAQVQLGQPVTARAFYHRLLRLTDRAALRDGRWALCPVDHSDSMVAWSWAAGDDRVVVVLNPSPSAGEWGHVTLPWSDLRGRRWRLRELLRGTDLGPREGTDLTEGRLYVEPRSWGADLLELTPLPG